MRTLAKSIFCCLLFAALPLWGGQPVITILHTNDVHGCCVTSDTAIGLDRVAAIRDRIRQTCPATLLVDAGDAIQGNSFMKWNHGQAAVEIMAAADYDALVPGNHEFDYGLERLFEIAASGAVPILTQPSVSQGAPGFASSALYERGGRVIGIFGVSTPQSKQSSDGGKDIDFGTNDEIIARASATAAMLRQHGAEVVVCLAHLGVDNATEFLTSYMLRDAATGIDVIIDGHSHTPLEEIEQAPGRALIASTGELGKNLGVVEFFCTEKGLSPVARTITKAETLDVEPAAAVASVTAKWVKEDKKHAGKVLARSREHFSADRIPMRTRQTQFGSFVADAIRDAAGSDIACINGGSIRADLPQGDITNAVLDSIFPYINLGATTATLTGAVVRQLLEHSVHRAPLEFGGFLQVSGITFTYDPSRQAGSKIVSAQVGGSPLKDDSQYNVTLYNWIAGGGDGYDMVAASFAPGNKTDMVDIPLAVVRWLNNHDGRAGDVDSQRIIEQK